ncbi:gamma-glutamylcyclotransferase [Saccharospirillum salsuginis]|uniref:glutathione-specific gamma-glutamylcyclotransferase n=1 Tax=Saccharospirillum salsuginis TaxID=418750 RepID=A0A918K5T7_9GAMM|nr:gamma-glutamylcyclotransferase [Saccharospirillum salsuginis]GGX48420.1 gamma-glutamylcyclotransferase [Saccharospirillum salsuginis]
MANNTIDINQAAHPLDHLDSVWLFGYGSLIYKVDFPILERQPASIRGWERRFWQGSHDHRGTPEAPGRVVTLIESPGAICQGMAYRVSPNTFAHLDHREKNGYLRFFTPLTFPEGHHAEGLVYVAGPDNPAFLGPAPMADMAEQIARSHGPSGSNADYVLSLAEALEELGADDRHVYELAERVDELLKN